MIGRYRGARNGPVLRSPCRSTGSRNRQPPRRLIGCGEQRVRTGDAEHTMHLAVPGMIRPDRRGVGIVQAELDGKGSVSRR